MKNNGSQPMKPIEKIFVGTLLIGMGVLFCFGLYLIAQMG